METFERLRPNGAIAVGDAERIRKDKYDNFRYQYQGYIMKWLLHSVNGLIAIYEFERLARLSEKDFKEFIGRIYDLNATVHACAMWAKLVDIVDIPGIFQSARPKSVEETRRLAYRASIRYRFVESTWLTWKYRIDMDPKLAKTYKDHMYDLWREMPE